MSIMIGVGLVPAQTPKGASPLPPPQGSISVDEFARDLVLFDSRAARGLNAAEIPLAGSAPAGARIEARAVPEAGSPGPWRTIATASGDGRYAGTLGDVARTPDWMTAEVRLEANPAIRAATANRFGVGHAIAFWGQSELARFLISGFAETGQAPAVADEDNLQVFYSEDNTGTADWGSPSLLRGGPVTDATPRSKHAAALSNALAAAYPGVKFSIAVHASGGTSRNQSAAPSGNVRNFAGEIAIRDLHAPHPGMEPGIVYESWFFNDMIDAGSGLDFVGELFGYVTGMQLDGSPDTTFGNHIFPDVYDPSVTVYGTSLHRYDGTNSIVNKMGASRAALRDLFATNPHVPAYLKEGTSALTYANAPSDSAHPVTGPGYEDGMVRLFRHLMAGALRVGGLETWEQPTFTDAALAADRTYVEVWSAAGDITTHRILDGAPRPAGYPEIWGFRHNDQRAEASIVDGRVRVFPASGTAFADGDIVQFADDGAGADPAVDTNLAAAIWKDHPVIVLADGPALLEAVPLRAATPQSVLGVIPVPSVPADPNPNPNLATPQFTAGAAGGSGADGWRGDTAAWTFNGDGTILSEPVTKAASIGTVAPKSALSGKRAELSFVLTSPNAASGVFFVRVSTQGGGGGNQMFQSASVPIALNQRTTLDLGVVPTANKRIEVEIRRETPAAGKLLFSEITIKERLP